jgi:hypothetical protein
MLRVTRNGDRFEIGSEKHEITLGPQPDPNWSHVDSRGHEHRWQQDDGRFTSTTFAYVIDELGIDDDGEQYDVAGHHECVICGEHVKPGTKAAGERRWVTGSSWFRINDEEVSEEEFRRRWEAQ